MAAPDNIRSLVESVRADIAEHDQAAGERSEWLELRRDHVEGLLAVAALYADRDEALARYWADKIGPLGAGVDHVR